MVSVVAVKKKTTKPTALYCERAVACGIRRRRRRTTTSSKGAKSSEHIRSAAAAVSRLCYARTKYCMNEFDKSLEHTHIRSFESSENAHRTITTACCAVVFLAHWQMPLQQQR